MAILTKMALAMRALEAAQSLIDNNGLLMSGCDSTKFNEMVQLHLRTWQRLALKFEAQCIPLAYIRPKHHYLQHIGLYIAKTRVNPRIHQNFNSESFMGKIKKNRCEVSLCFYGDACAAAVCGLPFFGMGASKKSIRNTGCCWGRVCGATFAS